MGGTLFPSYIYRWDLAGGTLFSTYIYRRDLAWWVRCFPPIYIGGI